jgi:hypothetical protein
LLKLKAFPQLAPMTAVGMVHAISVNVIVSMAMKASTVPRVSIFPDFLLLFFLMRLLIPVKMVG